MKNILLFALALFLHSFCSHAQIITTVAGNDSVAYCCDGGPAVDAGLYNPADVAVDTAGNIYIADCSNQRIRKVNTSGIITTIAGTGIPGYNGDGIAATTAELNYPSSIALDASGNIYICDDHNYRIRKINTAGIITTIAGTGILGYNGDNIPATTAQITTTAGIAVDGSGNVYIADMDSSRIRKISPGGMITNIAGSGVIGYGGDGGPATAAELDQPFGIAIDGSDQVYFAEYGNNRVRKINTIGIISTIAGTGTAGYNGDNIPATAAELDWPDGINIDSLGNLYIADVYNYRIRKVDISGIITTIAGTGSPDYNGDNILATLANIDPNGVTVDKSGNIYIADWGNNRIRRVGWPESVNELSAPSQKITIYPNPVATQLTISATNKITNIAISNLLGQTVYSHVYYNEQVQVNVADLPGGVYFLTATTLSTTNTQKIIINKCC